MSALPSPIPDLIKHLRSDPHPVIEPAGRDAFISRAPGRLDVMGGIADYAGGLVCELPLQAAAAVAVQRREDRMLVLHSYNPAAAGAAMRVELSLDDFWGSAALLPLDTIHRIFTGDRHWAAYVAGAFWILAKHRKLTRRVGGANIACYGDVPLDAGLAGSAALGVAAFAALTAAYHLILEPMEIAMMAQRVENQIADVPCGLMDQITATLGRADRLLLLQCQPHTIEGFADIPAGVRIVAVDSGIPAHVKATAYRDTRVASFMAQAMIARAYRDLGTRAGDPTKGYLANIKPRIYRTYFRPMLPQRLAGRDFLSRYGSTEDRATVVDPGTLYRVRDAADHQVLESARVREFVAALVHGGGQPLALARAGRLMYASHASYRHRAHLGHPDLDKLVGMIRQRGVAVGLYGARITSSGGGGSVAVLGQDSPESRRGLDEVVAEFARATGRSPRLLTGSSPGAAETGAAKLAATELFGQPAGDATGGHA